MIKDIAKNLLALFSGEVVARVCHFISVIYLARLFGASGFGAINFALAVLSYFLMFTNLGLGELGVREIARKRDPKDVAETILSIRCALGIAAYILLGVCAFAFRKSPETTALIIAYGLTIFPYALSLEWVFRGIEKMRYNAFGRIINAFLYVALVFLCVRKPADLLRVAFITLTADLVSCVFYYREYIKRYGMVTLHLQWRRWRALLPASAQLFVASAMVTIYINFGTVALGFAKDERAVGYYGAAAKLIFFVYALSDLFVAGIFPVVSRLFHEAEDKVSRCMAYCLKATVYFGLPVAVGGTFLGPSIISFVYGDAYKPSGPLFGILSWFAAINLTSFMVSYSLVACDRQRVYLKIMASATALNIAINAAALPYFGYYAPTIALVSTEAFILISSVCVLRRVISFPPVITFARAVLCALAMGGIIYFISCWNVFAVIVIASGAYAAMLFLSGAVTKGELVKMREIFAS